jgi:hypothetical protein
MQDFIWILINIIPVFYKEGCMVKHIVMWKLKDFAEGAGKEENARRIKEVLEALREKIPEVMHIEVGIDFNRSESAYDIVLYSEFESMDDLERYQEHAEHLKVAEFIQNVREDRVVVDYTVE